MTTGNMVQNRENSETSKCKRGLWSAIHWDVKESFNLAAKDRHAILGTNEATQECIRYDLIFILNYNCVCVCQVWKNMAQILREISEGDVVTGDFDLPSY